MSKVKTITVSGKVSEYDVKYTKAYVAKIISKQSDLYSELNPNDLPYNTVKEIYVDGILEAELIGSNLLYIQKRTSTPSPEEFDEDHALDMVMNNMLEDFTDEEIEEMMEPKEYIYLQSVTAAPPYWVTDTTVGDVDITYTN